jgi:hypothetical protein
MPRPAAKSRGNASLLMIILRNYGQAKIHLEKEKTTPALMIIIPKHRIS